MTIDNGLPLEALDRILKPIFCGEALVYEAYSEFDKDLKTFSSFESLKEYATRIATSNLCSDKDINLNIHYLKTGGRVYIEKVELNSDKCGGATQRYTTDGWGVINLVLFIKGNYFGIFTLHTRNENEAKDWEDTLPELGAYQDWDWTEVSYHFKYLEKEYKKVWKSYGQKL